MRNPKTKEYSKRLRIKRPSRAGNGRWRIENLEPRLPLSAAPIITEFAASNDTSLLDGNGNSSDWIEIYNSGSMAVDLVDFALADNPHEPGKWRFPSHVLGAGEYLVVFASGDAAPDADGNIHTNFKLSATGEYLSLSDPDGNLLSEYELGGADYPPQITDISYGREPTETVATVLPIGGSSQYVVPNSMTGPLLDGQWTQPEYVLGTSGETWQSGATGIGYDFDGDYEALIATDITSTLAGQSTSVYLRSTFDYSPDNPVETLRVRAHYDDGFVAYLNGVEVLSANGPVSSKVTDGSVALSNLFDDPKGTPLETAIASDEYQAAGGSNDLGVYTLIDGSLDVNQTIAPGVVFNLSNIGGGGDAVGGHPSNDTYRSSSSNAIRTTGVQNPPLTKVEDGIGMHANELLTFDLDELRSAGGFLPTNGYFTARAGLNDTAAPSGGSINAAVILSNSQGQVIGGYVNGQQVAVMESAGVWAFSGPLPSTLSGTGPYRFAHFAFPVPGAATYLTLVATSLSSPNSDHAVFSEATLEFQSVPLGNLFDDTHGTQLTTAVTTDTPQAQGDVGDLGVETVSNGEFQVTQIIAPQVLFDLSNVGNSVDASDARPSNDTWSSLSDQPIRTRGVGFSSLNEVVVEDGIGMPADGLITFDLNELRSAGGLSGNTEFRFKSRAGINDEATSSASALALAIVSDDAGNVTGAWANGQAIPLSNNSGVWSLDFSGGAPAELTPSSGTVDFDIVLSGNAAYLTLASGGGETDSSDHLVFPSARLVVLPNASGPSWDSAAGFPRDNAQAMLLDGFDLTPHLSLLNEGANVLAIHALNAARDDSDFLFSHEIVTSSVSYLDDSGRYFTHPTPGLPNDASAADVAPIILDVTDSPVVRDGDDIIVQATLFETVSPVANVRLDYRVMFGAETALTMLDDGSLGGDVAADGVYTAVIPAGVPGAGDMVRWRVTAEDDQARVTKAPKFSDPNKSPEYFGTMVHDDSFSSQLPVIYWFTNSESGATGGGARGSVFFNGEFYENILMRRRGQSSNNDPKKNLKFDFNPGHRFRLDPNLPRVDEINLNNTYYDKADVRATLASEVLRDSGTPSPITYSVRTQLNGQFWSLSVLVEQPGEEFLERNGLDPNGALYKVTGNNGLVSLSGIEKKTRLHEDYSDLQALIDGIAPSLPQSERATFLYDNVDVFSVINYLAGQSIIHNNDHVHKNHYLYRDSDGTGEWRFLPWDLDLTFGKNGAGTTNPGVVDSFLADEIPGGHPFFGNSDYRRFNAAEIWNRLIDAVLDTQELRELYLRRLRTVMDETLQAPETPAHELKLESRLEELYPLMLDDYELDDARWIEAPQNNKNAGADWGFDFTLRENFDRVKNLFLTPRREHLYETHSIDNRPLAGNPTTFVKQRSPMKFFVPTDNSLGTSWTTANFIDNGWTPGTMGIGYETSSANYASLIETSVRPQDATFGGATSIFTRIAFTIDEVDPGAALTLRMRYDDGFVAYLNGQEVARRNLTGAPAFNSTAQNHPDSEAVVFESIDISQHVDLLNSGGAKNVLAIHSINSSTGSSDQLLMAELVFGSFGPDPDQVAGIPHAHVNSPPITFDPVGLDTNPLSGNQDEEYLRLNNPTDQAADLTGWRIRGGIDIVMRAGTVIPSGRSLYVVADAKAFRSRTTGPAGGHQLLVLGNYDGRLSNLGETLELVDDQGTVIDTLTTPEQGTVNQQFLRVSEIYYNPPGSSDDTEFLEFMNVSSGSIATTLDLTGVTITDGPSAPFVFLPGTTLAAGERLVVVKSTSAFLAAYPAVDASYVAGIFQGRLSNAGETIRVQDSDGSEIFKLTYGESDPWPKTADGAGASLVLSDPYNTSSDQLGKHYRWRSSIQPGGTPTEDSLPPVSVVINEVLSHTSLPESDAIELHNTHTTSVDIGGWYLSDSDNDLLKFPIPLGTIIPAGGFVVFDESDFNPTPTNPGPNDFALNAAEGDEVWLVVSDGMGGMDAFVDQVEFGATFNGESLGRIPDGLGRLAPQASVTLGTGNRGPRIGPLIISEIQYNPGPPSAAALAVDSTLTEDDLEFVEIHNPTARMVDLANWGLAGEVPFDFPTGTILGAGQAIVVLSFDPTKAENSLRLDALRAHYGIESRVAFVGGFRERLNNHFGRVELEQPDAPPQDAPELFPRVTSDEVLFDDLTPWAETADGLGNSLQRVVPTAFGNAAESWKGAAPSPGSVDFSSAVLGDFTGDGLVTPDDLARLVDAVDASDPIDYYNLDTFGGVDAGDITFLIDAIVDPIPGDYDWNGTVSQADYDMWRFNYGSLLALHADGNRNGIVDAADMTVWRDNLGARASHAVNSEAAATQVSQSEVAVESWAEESTASGNPVVNSQNQLVRAPARLWPAVPSNRRFPSLARREEARGDQDRAPPAAKPLPPTAKTDWRRAVEAAHAERDVTSRMGRRAQRDWLTLRMVEDPWGDHELRKTHNGF